MINPAAYIAIFAFTLASGEKIETEEEIYPSYEECMLEAEAQARSMEKQWAWEEEKTSQPRFFKGVEVRCERKSSRDEKRENYGY